MISSLSLPGRETCRHLAGRGQRTCIMSPAWLAPASAMAPATKFGTTWRGAITAKTTCTTTACVKYVRTAYLKKFLEPAWVSKPA